MRHAGLAGNNRNDVEGKSAASEEASEEERAGMWREQPRHAGDDRPSSIPERVVTWQELKPAARGNSKVWLMKNMMMRAANYTAAQWQKRHLTVAAARWPPSR